MRYYIISIIIMLFGISIIVDPSAPMTLFDIPKGGNVEPIKYPLGLTFIVLGIMLFYSEQKKK